MVDTINTAAANIQAALNGMNALAIKNPGVAKGEQAYVVENLLREIPDNTTITFGYKNGNAPHEFSYVKKGDQFAPLSTGTNQGIPIPRSANSLAETMVNTKISAGFSTVNVSAKAGPQVAPVVAPPVPAPVDEFARLRALRQNVDATVNRMDAVMRQPAPMPAAPPPAPTPAPEADPRIVQDAQMTTALFQRLNRVDRQTAQGPLKYLDGYNVNPVDAAFDAFNNVKAGTDGIEPSEAQRMQAAIKAVENATPGFARYVANYFKAKGTVDLNAPVSSAETNDSVQGILATASPTLKAVLGKTGENIDRNQYGAGDQNAQISARVLGHKSAVSEEEKWDPSLKQSAQSVTVNRVTSADLDPGGFIRSGKSGGSTAFASLHEGTPRYRVASKSSRVIHLGADGNDTSYYMTSSRVADPRIPDVAALMGTMAPVTLARTPPAPAAPQPVA